MKFFSVLTKKEYQDESGQSNVQWFKAGFLKVTEGGGQYLQLYHLPDVTYYLVSQDDRQETVIDIDS